MINILFKLHLLNKINYLNNLKIIPLKKNNTA